MHICLFATSVFIPTGSSPSSLTGQLVRQPCCFPVRRRKPSCDRRDCEAGCWRFICSGGTAEVAGVKLLHLFAPKLLRNLLGFRFLRGSHEENNRSEGFKLKSQRRSRRLAAGCLPASQHVRNPRQREVLVFYYDKHMHNFDSKPSWSRL